MTSPVLPTGRLRLRFSRGPDGLAALGIYRPLTRRGRILRTAVTTLAALPVGRTGPDPLVAKLGDLLGMRVDGACVMASSMAGRRIVGLAGGGRLVAVAKVGRHDDMALRHENEVLAQLRSVSGIRVPRLLLSATAHDMVICVTEPVPGPPRQDWEAALQGAVGLARIGWTHGDFTPWNLVGRPATLLDWEAARPGLLPLFDLAHFVVRHEAQLGNGDPRAIVHRLCRADSLGAAYLAAAGLPLRQAPGLLRGYLDLAAPALTRPADAALYRAVRGLLR